MVVVLLVEVTWKQKLRSLLAMTAPFLGFLLAWSIRNILWIGTPTNRQVAIHPVTYQKVMEGVESFWDWLMPDTLAAFYQQNQASFAILFFLLLAAGIVVIAWQLFRLLRSAGKHTTGHTSRHTLLAISLSAVVYLGATLFSISFFDAATAFEHRILMPVYLPVLILILVGLAWLYRKPGLIPKLIVVLCILVAAWLSYSGGRIQVSLLARDGLGYANTTLRGSEVIEVIKAMPPDLIIYTNEPQLVYLVADRIAYMTPVFFDSIAYEYRDTYTQDLQIMRDQINNHEAVLVYFYEPDYATEPYYLELSEGLKPIGEYPFAFIFGPRN